MQVLLKEKLIKKIFDAYQKEYILNLGKNLHKMSFDQS